MKFSDLGFLLCRFKDFYCAEFRISVVQKSGSAHFYRICFIFKAWWDEFRRV
ncbi:hypothetical protein ADIS_1948 [Lunatimonas lonarensis]|uniref:Uncharacterized protein n=1 Tax=Lunatimonas lonarensis TaxID=1232681 RepID=R7ZTU3_9BACT|nr:hypothetical protein ADIS_1948 [Lunatimonas lonarensis]